MFTIGFEIDSERFGFDLLGAFFTLNRFRKLVWPNQFEIDLKVFAGVHITAKPP